jgi:ABC-type methionine transport system ATPase subunit
MAPKEAQKVVRFKMTFPEKVLGEPVIHHLSHDMHVTPNIMRGRITEKSAWLEVELSGAAKSIDKALKFLSERGVSVQQLD